MCYVCFFFLNNTATTEIYTYLHTLSLHDALPIFQAQAHRRHRRCRRGRETDRYHRAVSPRHFRRLRAGIETYFHPCAPAKAGVQDHRRRRSWLWVPAFAGRSEEHTSELQSLMRISYDVFCLKKKKRI